MDVIRQLDEHVWREFVDNHPLGNVFHTPEMFRVFADAKGHRPELWAAVEGERVLALLLPVQITLINSLLRHLTTRAVAYGSVLYDQNAAGEEALAVLLRTYRQQMHGRVLFTELRNLSDLGAVQPALNCDGFVYEDHLNYRIDLDRPAEEIMDGLRPRARKHLRQALKRQQVVVEPILDKIQLGTCYHLLQRSYKVAKVPLAHPSLFEAAFDILRPLGMAQFWLARVEDAGVATAITLLYKDVIYAWYLGVDRAFAHFMPTDILVWHALEWGSKNGYKIYDFGGAGKPDEVYGVRDFKAKFGGALVNYGRNFCVHARVRLKLSQAAYGLARRVLWAEHLGREK